MTQLRPSSTGTLEELSLEPSGTNLLSQDSYQLDNYYIIINIINKQIESRTWHFTYEHIKNIAAPHNHQGFPLNIKFSKLS